ncbi:hypothetical protein OKW21_001070 [Catalinimonas alkaloidigena]|uniref:hypothetical protein n=1 Tax=Catalinimonas alkaloidigena TaxID=1075417 RepID=UPI002404E660|nr:hypothetical protein [Catalinimonas alkaloidigena]MDF9795807.1 hypothetical protein [Catalinimonas alkaloidigena]
MKRWWQGIGAIVMLFFISTFFWAYSNVRDRHPNYQLNLEVNSENSAPTFKIGFAALPISPEVTDTWVDVNNDARYKLSDGDTYSDNNNNGKFDAVWMAGFHQNRPAQGIHDELWARTMVIDDGSSVISITALDAIGFGHDDVLDVRARVTEEAEITFPIISSTHTHEAPDLQGIWGPGIFKSGVDTAYMEFVKQQAAKSIVQAYKQREEAILKIGRDRSSAIPFVTDSRKPEVLDPGIRVIQAIAIDSSVTLGTLVSWGNHPETLWSKNLMISSDFPHYLRQGVEEGIYVNDSLIAPGLGGVCVYINGAIGGLMTTDPDWPIQDPWLDTTFLAPSFAKAATQGKQLAQIVLRTLSDSAEIISAAQAPIQIEASSFNIPLDNTNFRLASIIGLLDRGYSGWMKIRTEVAALRLGPVSIICVPGEIYPEIVNGGIESPEGQDFEIAPIETPPLRSLMPGKYKFVIGLANDQIGYIIPKSEWDAEPPYLYDAEKSPYGEVNSVGPETAPLVYQELKSLLNKLNQEKTSHVY